MNKLVKVLAASALVATALVGCGKKDGGDTPATNEAKFAKAGLGVVSTLNDEGQVNTTFVALGLDKDGKIQYIDLDVAQSTPGGEGELDKTKEERGTDYGMTQASGIKKEWNEQAEAFEAFCKGKTPDEVAQIETMDYHGGKAPKTGTDLAAGCTIVIDDFLAAVDKASKNAVEVNADKIQLGRVMSNDAEKKQLNTTLALVATDAEGKVLYTKIDVAQIYDNEGTKITDTKSERGTDYGMTQASGIKKEWNEQAEAFEAYCKGKTLDEIAKVETMDYHGGKAPATGTDLAAGCTIVIDDFLAALAKAK